MFTDFFIPTASNHYYPYSIRPRFLYTYLVFLLVFNVFGATLLSPFSTNVEAQTTYSPQDIIALTNQDRSQNALPSLTESTLLDNAATAKADDMFTYQYWAHNNPVTGATPWDFIIKAGYNYQYAGENLAQGFNTASDVNTAWMNSPEHRDNILDTNYTNIGVAVQYGTLQGQQVILVVQMFGSLSKPAVVPIQTPVAAPIAPHVTSTPKPAVKPTITKAIITTKPTAIQTPTPSLSPTPTTQPTLIAGPISPTVTPPAKILTRASNPAEKPSLLEYFGYEINTLQFVNRVDFIVAIFLVIIFTLDSLYYYKAPNTQLRLRPSSIAHLPLLAVLIVVCLLGTSGIIV